MIWKKIYVRVHLKDDAPSVEGLLHKRPGKFFRLVNAKLLVEPGQTHAAEGELFVPADNVLFFQEVEAA